MYLICILGFLLEGTLQQSEGAPRIVNQIILCQVLSIHAGLSPPILREKKSDRGRFASPSVKSSGRKSFAYNGCSLWNSLPQNARDVNSSFSFKIYDKQHFLCAVVFFKDILLLK